ncbi:propanediol utilization protein [Aliiruegeria haliotis]|uniref:Phosphate propanoyltransferase n=1 Tax=Aliiruegeria haliotis TaxID=1280846 RepID=A0A2T0RFW7_9RHOB|nr:phosphate propanoyltransferase [Aliiruegeria haliotis]PRY20063.1 propanediol utilization protein [Aliiruegeria haliotis]
MAATDSLIDRIVAELLEQGRAAAVQAATGDSSGTDPALVPVGVSNRHIHLSRQDMDALFGPGAVLTRKKASKQPGQYAAEETVILRGPKGEIGKVRVLGPLRKETQVEISKADGFVLGIHPPMRMSGELENTPGVEIVGPHGVVKTESGLIIAQRHIHMLPETAARLGLVNGEEVDVLAEGERGGVLHHVAIRTAEASTLELHIDVEEANGLGLKNDDRVRIVRA